MDDKLIKKELAKRELARRHFADYLAYAYGDSWIATRFARYLAERVQSFAETDTGHAYDILVINTPPQHGKSMTLTQSFPAWYIGKHPDKRIIMLSYNDTLAQGFLRHNRRKITDCGKVLFGGGVGDISRATDLTVSNGTGSILSRGIMGGITGNPADLIIIDDPIKNREEADSETYREKLWDEWLNSIHSRLSAGAKVILIMTPWHQDDLSARLLQREKNCTLLRLPIEAEADDPMGRAVGDSLCPELGKDRAWLAETKAAYIADPQGGMRAWQALYQCSPRTEGGNLVKRDWWRFYSAQELPREGRQYISVDATFKGGEGNDFVAITVWQQTGCDFYLLYCLNRHLDFPQTLDALRSVKQMYRSAGAVLIEDKANGSAIISTLQKEMFCIPVNPQGGKVSRVNAVSPAIESGHVYLPKDAPWLEEYLEQWTAFPAAAHDDMVDSSTQALSYMIPLSGTSDTMTDAEKYERWAGDEDDRAFVSPDLFDPYTQRFNPVYYEKYEDDFDPYN